MSNTSEDSLTKDLFTAYEEFRKNFPPHQVSFPDVDAFQKKMIGKGYLLYQTSDYLSSVIYLSIALWTYAIKPRSEDSVNSLKKFISDARGKLSASISNNQNEDSPMYLPTSEDEMRDKITGKLISFSTMSGASREKSIITNKFIYPNLFPHLFLSDLNNILMYGSAGVGKTLIAKASVGELNRQANGEFKFLFYSLSASDVRSKWEGGTEKNIALMFQTASKRAKEEEEKYNKSSSKKIKVKSILFLDEVESIAESRDKGGDKRALTTLLQKMDGMKSEDNVIIMAATNIPWELDPAFVRRFSASIFVDLPDFLSRADLLINTFIDKYEKHSDVRRLLSFIVIPDKDDKEWENIQKYELKGDDDPTKKIMDDISRMYDILPKDSLFALGGRKNMKTSLEKYTVIIMNRIKSLISSKYNIKVDWSVWMTTRFDKYINFVKFIFHISDLMGPSYKVLKKFAGSTLGKRATSNSRTKYGYSASDITKIVSEFFAITAEKIIQSQFSHSSSSSFCDDEFIEEGSRKNNCYIKLTSQQSIEHANDGMFLILSDAKNKEERFLTEKNGKYQDSYTVFVPRLFNMAMDNYPSTTGNLDTYCNYIQYEASGAIPNWKEKCEKISMDESSGSE